MQHLKWITLAMATVFLVAVAGVVNAPHLYYMAAILLTLPGVSYTLGWMSLRGLEFSRSLPPVAWANEEADIAYMVENRSRVSRYFLTIFESLPHWITPVGGEPPLFNVPAADSARVEQRVKFLKRGVYRVQSFDVTAIDPLGVFAFTHEVPADGELVVYPSVQPLDGLPLAGADRHGWQEFATAVMQGSGVDPDGVRLYVPGDPLRRIHWRQTARTGSLTVLEFDEPEAISLVVVLDLERGTEVGSGADTTLEYGVTVAASAVQLAIRQGASARLVTWRDAAAPPPPPAGRGQHQLYGILEELARVEARAPASAAEVLHNEVGVIPPGTSLLVITARADTALAGSIARYTGAGIKVVVAYVDPDSVDVDRSRALNRSAEEFLADLVAAGAQPFVVRPDPERRLYAEPVLYAKAAALST